ncbi:MAG: trehalose-6-phosphate synthase [Calditrichaeota bacterium]|nr:trehalose-6-phosphate synthase [Calditrichota bacterium]
MFEQKDDHPRSKVIIVSNRLPIAVTKDESGNWHVESGSGGLVTALAPVLKNRGGLWIGWPGIHAEEGLNLDALLKSATRDSGYRLKPVLLTEEEIKKYYMGFSNEVLWPLFHDFVPFCNFRPEYWKFYTRVNKKFAEVVQANSSGRDFIWIHDYHLIGVAKELREMGDKSKLGFFLHIPFPPLDIFLKLPWRFQILRLLFQYDLVGFQTLRDRRNFIQCVRTLMHDMSIQGKGQVIRIKTENREIRVGVFPISIDYHEFANLAKTERVSKEAWYIHENLPEVKIILGIDRLDYSKGIIEKLNAYRNALLRYPELQGNVILAQILVPSRRSIPMYAALKEEIEQLVGEINGQFTRSGWIPIYYRFQSLGRVELVAHYRTAEILLVTPPKDGMNLVSKEYCASNIEENGVVVVSEFAGVAAQFQKSAILINPYDIEGVADAIYRAYSMTPEERRMRMHKLRQSIRKTDIYWWVNSFLLAAIAKRLDNFPIVEDYIPIYDDEESFSENG